jgi:hypothetical protein
MTTLLSNDVIALLRPLQKVIRETSQLIQASPWAALASPGQSNGNGNSAYTLQSPSSQISLPMTPASAALGPAVQATVPSTPQSASYSTTMFHGNVFERADALLSTTNGAFSRTGTMTSAFISGDSNAPGSILSPSMNLRYMGIGGKVVF